jgi:hypothetical protein
MILAKAFSADMERYSVSSSGKNNTIPEVGFGDVGIKTVRMISSAIFCLLVTKPITYPFPKGTLTTPKYLPSDSPAPLKDETRSFIILYQEPMKPRFP